MSKLFLVETRKVKTSDGAQHEQNRIHCPVHGYFDLFVFPEAAANHGSCRSDEENQSALPPVSILSNIEDYWQHGL